jgi:hypothetical protein
MPTGRQLYVKLTSIGAGIIAIILAFILFLPQDGAPPSLPVQPVGAQIIDNTTSDDGPPTPVSSPPTMSIELPKSPHIVPVFPSEPVALPEVVIINATNLGSNSTEILPVHAPGVHGGGGSGGGGSSSSCNNENNQNNILLADAGVINMGQTTKLTQHLDTCNGLSGTMQELKVTEPDGDVCVAIGLPTAVPDITHNVTKTYPTDFTLSYSAGSGDSICNTENVGIYTAESEVNVNGVVKTSSATFETNFFVLPESPIGSLLLAGVALVALGGYYSYPKIMNLKRATV